jgi:hypothetical protein
MVKTVVPALVHVTAPFWLADVHDAHLALKVSNLSWLAPIVNVPLVATPVPQKLGWRPAALSLMVAAFADVFLMLIAKNLPSSKLSWVWPTPKSRVMPFAGE